MFFFTILMSLYKLFDTILIQVDEKNAKIKRFNTNLGTKQLR